MPRPDSSTPEETFLATASHEIRTPLNGIIGMASLLSETKLSHAQRDYVDAIRTSSQRLLELLNNVLDYARFSAADIELERERFAPADLAQEVVELLAPRAHDAALDLALRRRPGAQTQVWGDAGRVRQILFNLIGNALKFTERGGVLVDVGYRTGHLEFRIIDTGPGIPEVDRNSLFEAFRQQDAADAYKDGGVGLGLAIVKQLSDQMNGAITVGGAPGLGAAFSVRIPLETDETSPRAPHLISGRIGLIGLPPATLLASAEALLAAGATPHALFDAPKDSSAYTAIIANADLPRTQLSELSRSAPTLVALRAEDRKALEGFRKLGCIGWLIRPFRAESFISRVRLAAAGDNAALEPAVPPRGGRVLIADDNPVNALIARRALEKDGFRVTLAATGVEALESVATAPYDMILMDLRMPVMDGFEAMSRLREGGDMTPVIAVSAEVNPVIERRAKAAGADAVAAKPLDANALRAIAAEWAAPRADAAE